MAYDPKIHHRKSIRLKGYDYSKGGLYFITMCCHKRQCLFGKIVVPKIDSPAQMKLNDGGIIAEKCWVAIPEHFPNAVLHEYVIMPNHVHGIIELKKNENIEGANNHSPDTANNHSPDTANNHSPDTANNHSPDTANNHSPDTANGNSRGKNIITVGAKDFSPQPKDFSPQPKDFSPQPKDFSPQPKDFSPRFRSPSRTIGSVVRGFKIGVTKWFRNNTDIHTVWQRNYYEHIIRDKRAYRNISKYIANNPANWKGDKFYG